MSLVNEIGSLGRAADCAGANTSSAHSNAARATETTKETVSQRRNGETELAKYGNHLRFLPDAQPLDEEPLEGVDDRQRRFLREVVARVERTACHVARDFPPDRQLVAVVEHSGVAAASPQDQRPRLDIVAGSVIRLIVLEIDSCRGAIVLARTVNRPVREAAHVLGDGPLVEERRLAGPPEVAQDELPSRNRRDHALEHLVGLCHERPMPRVQRPLARGVAPHVARRENVEQGDLAHAVGMVQRQPMRGARSAVVPRKKEAVMAERGHHVDLIARHGAKRVMAMIGAAVDGADAVAVPAQIGGYDVEFCRQPAGDLVPAGMRLRVAMEQQQRRARTSVPQEDVGPVGPDPPGFETIEQAAVWRERPRHGTRRSALGGGIFGCANELTAKSGSRGCHELSAIDRHRITPFLRDREAHDYDRVRLALDFIGESRVEVQQCSLAFTDWPTVTPTLYPEKVR